ncbi:hypothetical protein J8H63_00165 [Staphylococcus chromogenes]|uniref:hypothetical protein n=1 Tax=Staphylococcus chromogenes TaxID=46126 RepID=UPI000CD17B53|nr:hypothetical protein [Staphylococcus chromogenes]MBP0044978.1 hypothetical protein [Staphylococcus chromogenes]PNY96902.1 hypothetical protein CD151_02180 [Staphylococcus chromogenes]GGI30919.1 hypothetical protein GCM10008139_06750 [Staphylococcus chromogenes]SUM13391.1 phage protein [Staphylococcus chromogenes]
MVKIKTKKEMTLPELIEWAWENGIKNESFLASRGGRVYFDEDSWIGVDESTLVEPEDIFTVETEEEIDEDTIIPTLIELFVSDYGQIMHMYFSESINGAIGDVDDDAKALSKAFYILNDDYTMTLIWREGEFVE